MPSTKMTPANIEWQQGIPVSTQFGDVYYSRDDGIAETQHVFLHHNHLPERWKNPSFDTFTIAETGFGTGLNFFCALELWCSLNTGKHLHFISVEKHPLQKSDFELTCAKHPRFKKFSDALIQQYPPLIQGIHRLQLFDINVTLTLLFGEADEQFSQLTGAVDAWFLDGFAPSCNPEMWSPTLFNSLSRLSNPGTTVATFTSAGVVKRGLQTAGFLIQKVVGYGRKRAMLCGEFGSDTHTEKHLPPQDKPWFNTTASRQCAGTVAVIGAGLAGCSVAHALARRGWQVSVIEKESTIATQGSGNPTGITFTKLSLHDSPQNRYYQSAYLYSCRWIRQWLQYCEIPEGTDWSFQGLIRLAHNDKELAEQEALIAHQYWPETCLEALSLEQLSSRFGINSHQPALLLKDGGWLNPAMLCNALLQHPNITLETDHCVESLEQHDNQWQLNPSQKRFDAVVLACTFACQAFEQTKHLDLRSVRGQISYIPTTQASSALTHPINYEGYINPAWKGFHCVGATFSPKIKHTDERTEDHEWNLNHLKSALPHLAHALTLDQAPTIGRVAFRCQTPDYLPIIGPVPDDQFYRSTYDDLRKGFLKRLFPEGKSLPGLYVSTGHGSRGITSTGFAAEIIAAYMSNEPQIIDREVLQATHPARFLIRNIIRRKDGRS